MLRFADAHSNIIENNADLSFVSDELCSGFDLISINKLDPEV